MRAFLLLPLPFACFSTPALAQGLSESLAAYRANRIKRYAEHAGLPGRLRQHPDWRRIAAYFEQRRVIEAAALRAYRASTRGKEVGDALNGAMRDAAIALMGTAGVSDDPRQVLLDQFGLFGTIGNTGGFLDPADQGSRHRGLVGGPAFGQPRVGLKRMETLAEYILYANRPDHPPVRRPHSRSPAPLRRVQPVR